MAARFKYLLWDKNKTAYVRFCVIANLKTSNGVPEGLALNKVRNTKL
jgi:hypothetical protein